MAKKLSDRLVEMTPGLDRIADLMHQAYAPVLGPEGPRGVKDALYGVWLGHPLHPAVVTMPIGFWTTTTMLDAMGEEKFADLSLKLGVVTALGAAATGAAQWQDTYNQEKPKRLGALHALLNVAATGLYGASWIARSNGQRSTGITLSTVGFGLANVSAWLGGDLSYDLGVGVNRTAFEQPPDDWTDVAAETELEENTPKRVDASGVPVLLVKVKGDILAISAVCTHLGAPLDEGEIDGETVICPWHGSVFCLRDGTVQHGPATAPEPAYEVRVRAGRVEVRVAA